MQEPSAPTPTASTGKVRPSVDIVVTTVLTMTIVFLINGFFLETAVAIGSFAGFCVAAWNWFRMGRRRKAFFHLLLGFGVYLLFNLGYTLLLILGQKLSDVLNAILLIVFDFGLATLVVTYLYKATVRDNQDNQLAGSEPIENYNFLPLLGIAALSVVFIMTASTFLNQVRTAQLQNHVYCELLQPSMTFEEVDAALNQIGPHRRVWFEDVSYPEISAQATSYDWVFWTSGGIERDRDLDLLLGFDANDRLVWKGRYGSGGSKASVEEKSDTIECPWTFSQSVTAR